MTTVSRIFANICRIDEEKRMVWGYLATTNKAADNLTLTLDAIKNGFAEWWQWGNIREMHQPSAVGVVPEGEGVVDELGAYGGAYIADDPAWAKVVAKVYKAFSVKFRIVARDVVDTTIITAIKVLEVSLVDVPADPTCVFDVYRAADSEEPPMTKKPLAFAEDSAEAQAAAAAAAETERAAEGGKEGEEQPGPAPAPAEDPAKGDPPAEEPPLAADPLSEAARSQFNAAIANLERIEAGRTGAAPGEHDIARSMWTVRDLASLLSSLAYLVNDTTWEAALDGEGSGVPDKLRAALKTLGEAFKQLSAQETDQLLASAGVGVSRALDYALVQGGEAALTADEQAAVQRALDGFVKRGFKLPEVKPAPAAATPAPAGDDVARLQGEVDVLKGEITARDDAMAEINRRLEALANSPAPLKTAASEAAVRPIDKGADAAGAGGAAPAAAGATPSDEDVARALAAMPEAERANLLMRAALRRPIPIGAR